MIKLTARALTFPLAEVFSISRGSRTEAHVVEVELHADGFCGRGECLPYARYGESIESVLQQIESLQNGLADLDNNTLQERLPPGAARNAVDCALWDLKAKHSGQPVWQLLGLPAPTPLTTAYTLPLEQPEAMQAKATREAHRPLLKIKLGGEEDMARLEAVRKGAPTARLIVDANEGWDLALYQSLAPHLIKLGVDLVEQPLPAAKDQALLGIDRPVPLCADESCHDRASLVDLQGKYDFINIKLDKTGGLTEALALRDAAQRSNLGIMVGCMVASSLAMAPAMLVAEGTRYVDLDGPLLLAEDRPEGLHYTGSKIAPASTKLWG